MNEEVSIPGDERIAIFVIAYNAESHIEQTLSRIPDSVWDRVDEVFIVDDCSTDETVPRAMAFEKGKNKIRVLRNRTNRRYGGNQKYGYQYAIDNGFDVVAMLHADGQYAPEFLPTLFRAVVVDKCDVVFGSRMIEPGAAKAGGMPGYKRIGNHILTTIQNKLSGMNLSEFHSGYRVYRTSFLKSVPFWENTDEWHFDTHILFQAEQAKAEICELPIPTYYGDEICHVNGIAYGINCIRTSLGFWLYRRGVVYSRKYDLTIQGQRYFSKLDDEWSSHSVLWTWLQEHGVKGSEVLELGVGDACLSRLLHEGEAIVDGLDIDQEYLDIAKPYCRSIERLSLDDQSALDHLQTYDIGLAADVLEHLADPEYVLSTLKRVIKKDGRLYVSLPNVANLYVRLNVLLGRFPYHSKGILDRTHLHFYTGSTARLMLKRTGWTVERDDVTSIPVGIVFPFLRRKGWRWVLSLLRGLTRLLPGLLGYQFVFECRNPNEGVLL